MGIAYFARVGELCTVESKMTLRELPVGASAVILSVGGDGVLRQHFLDMGLIPGAHVKLVKYAPLGDPMELLVSGYTLTLRLAEAAQIEIEAVDGAGAFRGRRPVCRTGGSRCPPGLRRRRQIP